jgi:regulator of protease activity HflC (stomatin/prohibitin superfamily)
MATASTIVLFVIILFLLVAFLSTFKVVPQRSVYIVERLGKFNKALDAGFHILIPFVDKVAYKQNLKEQAIDVASQICITKDNIAVEVDGVIYLQVIDPQKASYGIDNYRFAVIQISQTTMRSVIGKMELDKTFEEREAVNATIVEAVDRASGPWGIKVSRY